MLSSLKAASFWRKTIWDYMLIFDLYSSIDSSAMEKRTDKTSLLSVIDFTALRQCEKIKFVISSAHKKS